MGGGEGRGGEGRGERSLNFYAQSSKLSSPLTDLAATCTRSSSSGDLSSSEESRWEAEGERAAR